MKKNFLNTSLAAMLLMGFVACKNNSTPTPAANTTTTPSTTTTTTTPEPAAKTEQEKAIEEGAQKMCSCDGVKNYFAKMKAFDGKTDAEFEKEMKTKLAEFAPLKKPLDECTKSIKAEMETKYASFKDTTGAFQKQMIKTCGDIMPQRLIDKYSK